MNAPENIVIVGSSGHARVIIDIVEREGRYRISGLLDRFREVGEETLGYRVLGKEEDLPELMREQGVQGVIVAIGDNFVRAQTAQRVKEVCPSIVFVRAIHPDASVARNVPIGAGTVIMAGAVINPCCSIGRFCILNTSSSLDHDSVMHDFASLAPHVAAGGECCVGAYSAIGIGAVLVNRIHIGEHTVIGAGSTVIQSIESFKVAYGVPARAVRDRKAGEKYL